MHEALRLVREGTRGTGFEGRIWLVGGAVRDDLIGVEPPQEFDLVLEASAAELVEFLSVKGIADSRPVVYENFGTAALVVAGMNLEFVTARSESYRGHSRKPAVEPATIAEDALRRDFTVNALLRNLHSWQLTDPLGSGLDDLRQRILRTPLDPVSTFRDDPLRMLRAVRFRWQLGFMPVDGLYDAIRETADRLEIVSGERIRDEILKMLLRPTAADAMDDLLRTGLFHVLAPELESMVGVEQGDYHHLDVWDHSLLVLRNVGNADPLLSLSALLHDVGKPGTRMIDDRGRTRFFGHETAGETIARAILNRLKFSGDDIDTVTTLIRNHMRLGTAPEFSDAAARRLVRDMGGNLPRLLDLVEADASALKAGVKVLDLRSLRAKIEAVAERALEVRLESPLSGSEIMQIGGLSEGTDIGRLKAMLTEAVLEGSLAAGDKVRAAEMLRAAIRGGP